MTQKCNLKPFRLTTFFRTMHGMISASLFNKKIQISFKEFGSGSAVYDCRSATLVFAPKPPPRGWTEKLMSSEGLGIFWVRTILCRGSESIKCGSRFGLSGKMCIFFVCCCRIRIQGKLQIRPDPQHWSGRFQPKERKNFINYLVQKQT